jgi:hypothetical protein
MGQKYQYFMGGRKRMALWKRFVVPVVIAMLLAAITVLAGCGAKTETAKESTSSTSATTEAPKYKIGVVTPAFSASEDEYRGGEKVAKKYPGIIKHVVLPEDFQAEQETAISQITSLADDKDTKAIVICAGYTGILPAIQKVKEKRSDIKVITAPIWDDPDLMAKYIDLCLDTDAVKRGTNIVQKAEKMGAKTLIHYSFPSHMAKELLAKRRDTMKSEAEKLGMKFVHIMTPDPATGEAGVSAMQQFLSEDVPKQAAKYGKDTAIFGSNCGMQEVIIAQAMKNGLIVAEQCCPTPTQGYPAALGIEIDKDAAGDVDKLNQLIKEKVAEGHNSGRMATWPVPLGVFFPEFSVEVAKSMIEDNFDPANMEALKDKAKKVAGVDVAFDKYNNKNNSYFIIMDSIIY